MPGSAAPVRALPVIVAAAEPEVPRSHPTGAANGHVVQVIPTVSHELVHRRFEQQARRTPEAVALSFEGRQLSYAELNGRANQLAHHLRSLGVGTETLVGVCVERSPEMIVAILGTLKAGAAYVPLDPTYPSERLAYTLRDAQAPVVLTQARLHAQLPAGGARIVRLDDDWPAIGAQSRDDPAPVGTRENLAYVIYTSGSTGQPKGVMVTHAGLSNYLAWAESAYGDATGTSAILHSSFAFDLTVTSVYLPLLTGGRLRVLPEGKGPTELALALSQERGISFVKITPSHFSLLTNDLERHGLAGTTRRFVIGGEALPSRDVRTWMKADPAVQIINEYGPTETVVGCCVHWTTPSDLEAGTIPIGRAIANTQLHVLDPQGRIVRDGEPGELFIGGEGVARGYLNRAELTAERFPPDPFSKKPGARMYRTGDLVRCRPDGVLEFLGRVDHQVKIRGYRIELGEVEAALLSHPQVREAMVVAREDEPGQKRLVAYFVPASETPRPSALRDHLRRTLPEYMVPAAFQAMPSLPLTSNGKIDRQSLPAPDDDRPDTGVSYVAPRLRNEELVAAIWCEVLRLQRVGVHDNFLEIGGHSLLATQVATRVREAFAVDVSVLDVFNAPTVAELTALVERRNHEDRDHEAVAWRHVARDGELPISFAQERALFMHELAPDAKAYHTQSLIRFRGPLDVGLLERSLDEIIRRHEIFRTTFHKTKTSATQVVHEPWRVSIPIVDLRDVDSGQREAALERFVWEEVAHGFDLTQLPLVRWHLVRMSEEDHVLVHVEHHLIHDGWSFNVFLRELFELYRAYCQGQAPSLPEPHQFCDFASWQREWMKGAAARGQLDYWTQRLAGCSPFLELPTDHPRPPAKTYKGASFRFELDEQLSEALRRLSRRLGTTLYNTMFAGFSTLVHRYTGSTDFNLGSGMANRRWRETETLIGMVINTIVMRVDASGDPTFQGLVKRLQSDMLGAYANQDLPFEKLVEALRPERSLSYNPLFQASFSFHDSPLPELRVPGLSVEILEAIPNGSSKFDLNVIVVPRREQRVASADDGPAGITLIWEYSTDLFEEATMRRMVGHFRTLLEAVVAQPEARLSELPVMSATEQRQVVETWNRTEARYPHDPPIHELFEAQVKRAPDALAVAHGDERLTYAELNVRANRLAHHLRGFGVGPETLVGICVERGLGMVVGALGVLKAGAAFVPLDPAYPSERLTFMVKDSRAPVVLTQARLAERLEPAGVRLVRLDTDWPDVEGQPETNPVSGAGVRNLAYAIYTSGSTGQPKGVLVEHESLLNLVHWHNDTYGLGPADRTSQVAGCAFDASIWETWPTLLAGASLHVAPEEARVDPDALRSWLITHGITVAFAPTPVAERLIEGDWSGAALRFLLTGGDALHAPPPAALPFSLVNHYGPTEATVLITAGRVLPGLRDPPHIGGPIANTRVYVLDPYGRPVPPGVAGELYVAGRGLARGYLHRPELTEQRFVPDPFSGQPHARLYRTGDLVRWRPDGTLDFVGRLDHQVKIRGMRIELGEIESTLARHPAVREAVVTARHDPPSAKRLVGYVVPSNGVVPSTTELKDHLKHSLPEYMVPSAFVVLDRLPLTPNGKVDRKALPAPEAGRADPAHEHVAPRGPLEHAVAEIWRDVLRLERVGVRDNFFDVGGHSLVASQIVSRVREAFSVEMPLSTLFNCPTVERLSTEVETLLRERLLAEIAAIPDDEAERIFAEALDIKNA